MKSYFKDNRGVTLVELMVAVVVFAVITIPLLNSFKTATLTVVKSEKMGSVSMAAQNVMERVETSKVDDLVNDADAAKTALSAENATYYEKSGSVYSVRTNSGSVPYCIWLEGVSSGEKKYNAMVEIMPDGTINNEELSVLTPMQIAYLQPVGDDDPDKQAKDLETFMRTIKAREIVIDVTKAGTILNLKVAYDYEYDRWGFGGPGGYGPGDIEYNASYEIADGERPAVYVIYTPMFDIEDNLVIRNSDNVDFDLFIIKRDAESLGDPYKCTVNQEGMPVNIYTNINDVGGHILIDYSFNGLPFMGVPGNVNNYLVLKESKERAHNITVKIYPHDMDFNSEPMFELEGMTID